MPVLPCVIEFDNVELKTHRAMDRKLSLRRKRAEYAKRSESLRARAAASGASTQGSRAATRKPQGAVRTAMRTCLSLGVVESGTDIPCVSQGKHGQKPSVSPLMTCQTSLEFEADFEDLLFLSPHQALETPPTQRLRRNSKLHETIDMINVDGGKDAEEECAAGGASEAQLPFVGTGSPESSLTQGAICDHDVDLEAEELHRDIMESTTPQGSGNDHGTSIVEHFEATRVKKGGCSESEGDSTTGTDSTADTREHGNNMVEVGMRSERLKIEVDDLLREKRRLEDEFKATKEEIARVAIDIKRKAVVEAVAIQRRAHEIANTREETALSGDTPNISLQQNPAPAISEPIRDEAANKSKAKPHLKQAKCLQQQLARQFRTQAQREKRVEQDGQRELERTRALAAEELGRAQREAADIKAEACALQARAREEIRSAASAEIEAARTAAEAEARRILSQAEERAKLLRREAEELLGGSRGSSDAELDIVSQCVREPEEEWDLLRAEDESAQDDGFEWAMVC